MREDMFKYKITFKNKEKLIIRANSPKQAYLVASKLGSVLFIKYVR